MYSERRDKINTYIQEKGEVHLSELATLFPNVSSMTLRRDLEFLEQKEEIVRTRGGAKSIAHLTQTKEDIYSSRLSENTEAKRLIAQKASQFLEGGRSIYLDSGTTLMNLAKILPDDNFSIITCAPNIGLMAIKKPKTNVIMTGGNLNRDNLSMTGNTAIRFLENLNIDIAFMAASGFSLDSGFTCGNYDECELKRFVIGKARRKILLMDTGKLNRNMPYTFAQIGDIDILIAEDYMPVEIKKVLEQHRVITV